VGAVRIFTLRRCCTNGDTGSVVRRDTWLATVVATKPLVQATLKSIIITFRQKKANECLRSRRCSTTLYSVLRCQTLLYKQGRGATHSKNSASGISRPDTLNRVLPYRLINPSRVHARKAGHFGTMSVMTTGTLGNSYLGFDKQTNSKQTG
jgi:hypothetical protein